MRFALVPQNSHRGLAMHALEKLVDHSSNPQQVFTALRFVCLSLFNLQMYSSLSTVLEKHLNGAHLHERIAILTRLVEFLIRPFNFCYFCQLLQNSTSNTAYKFIVYIYGCMTFPNHGIFLNHDMTCLSSEWLTPLITLHSLRCLVRLKLTFMTSATVERM